MEGLPFANDLPIEHAEDSYLGCQEAGGRRMSQKDSSTLKLWVIIFVFIFTNWDGSVYSCIYTIGKRFFPKLTWKSVSSKPCLWVPITLIKLIGTHVCLIAHHCVPFWNFVCKEVSRIKFKCSGMLYFFVFLGGMITTWENSTGCSSRSRKWH